jgi:hypothetical protein
MTEAPAWIKSPWWKALSIGMVLIGLASIFPAYVATAFIFNSPSASVFFVAVGVLALPFLLISCAILPYLPKSRHRTRLIFLVPLLDLLLMPILWWVAAFFSGSGTGSDLFQHTFDGPCENFKVDDLPSPSRHLLIDRSENRCANEIHTSALLFSLLRTGEPFNERRVFASSTGQGGNRSPLTVFSKWIDDTHLVVATPEGSTLDIAQSELDGVHIQYTSYPLDATRTKENNLKREIAKKVIFESTFDKTAGVGTSGVGCNLSASAYDGEYIDNLEIALSARKTFATESWSGDKVEKNKAYSVFDFQIRARDQIERPGIHATGADIIGFTPKNGKSRLWSYDVSYPQSKTVDGNPRSKWYFAYTPTDPHDLISIAEQLRIGNISIRTGYFLDNKIVIYTSEKSTNQGSIEKFEKCILDNKIFDIPQFGSTK